MDAKSLHGKYREIFRKAVEPLLKSGGRPNQMVRCYVSFEEFDKAYPTIEEKARIVAEAEKGFNESLGACEAAFRYLEREGLIVRNGQSAVKTSKAIELFNQGSLDMNGAL